MNEYQQREHEKSAVLRAEIQLIGDEMGLWKLQPDNPEMDHAPRSFYLSNGKYRIRVNAIWNHTERLEFTACEFGSYINTEGRETHLYPSDFGNNWSGNDFVPREITPTTTAARSRTPAAIAKQVKNKIIPEYLRIYDALQELGASRQGYTDKDTEAKAILYAATQDKQAKPHHKPHFVRNINGHLYIKYNSAESVSIDLTASEAAKVINFIREDRAS